MGVEWNQLRIRRRHNGAGYFFGYTFSRFMGLSKVDARTLAFKVGLQNGSMATGLAGTMGKLGTVDQLTMMLYFT